jgi:hypothetical protein
MKVSKEAIIGTIFVFVVLGVIASVTGIYGILYLSIAYLLMVISIKLFFRKSVAAKTGAVVLNTDIAYKMLMPSKYKKAIKALDCKEKHERT